ncbi:MAG: beta-ketoacyl-ACP synthase [Deltaproteobacteria bacterium]|nr:beta-ketoacyl-ACP synthase [Deltaproteobacteria bacterium]
MNFTGERAWPITAFGAVNALGRSTREVMAALDAGTSGLGAPPFDVPLQTFAGAVPGELPPLPAEYAAWDCRLARLGVLAYADVAQQVEAAVARWGAHRVAVVLGTSTGGLEATESALLEWKRGGALPASYDFRRQHGFDALGELLARMAGVEGPVYTLSTACSSSGKVMGVADRLLRAGVVDAVLAGGSDSLTRMTLQGFFGLGVLSAERCRPFGAGRDGINIGEGAAFVLLERAGDSQLRLLGVGESSDAHHMSSPHPEGRGAEEAMRRALDAARVAPAEIDWVNAHGTATKLNDQAEGRALERVFGREVPITSTKGYTGHILGGAGSAEAVFCLHALEIGRLPASLGAAPVDPVFDLDLVEEPREGDIRRVLSNSFAFGGSNVCLCFGRDEAARAEAVAAPDPRLPSARVAGVALWAPGYANLHAYLTGAHDPSVDMPACSVASSRIKRGTSRFARMLGEVAERACSAAGGDLSRVASVYSSAWGEIDIMVTLLEQIAEGERGLSPLRFKHSVHNAASGLVSIAKGNRGFSTAMAAGRRSFEMGLLEAFGLLAADEREVLLCVADDRLPEPLGRFAAHQGLAVGFYLVRESPEACAHYPEAPLLSAPRPWVDTDQRAAPPKVFADNPAAEALPLLRAVAEARAVSLRLSDDPHALAVALLPPESNT